MSIEVALQKWVEDPSYSDELSALVYQNLHQLASSSRDRLQAAEGLREPHSTTTVVHEIYLKLKSHRPTEMLDSERQLMKYLSKISRDVLVDMARKERAKKRNGSLSRQPEQDDQSQMIALDWALSRLEKLDPACCQTLQLYYFGSFSQREIAELVAQPLEHVKQQLNFGRAFIRTQLS